MKDSKLNVLLLLLLGALLVLPIYFLAPVFPADDALIHVRVLENLVSERMPLFNPPERVDVSSSPIWSLALLLPSLSADGDKLLNLVSYLQIGIFLGLLLTLYSLLLDFGFQRFAAVLGSFLLSSLCLSSGVALMETPLAFLFFVCAVQLLKQEKHSRAFVFFGLAAATRIEFIFGGLLFLIFRPERNLKKSLESAIAFLVPLVPVFIFRFTLFADVFPSGARAKSVVYDLSIVESFMRLIHSALFGTILAKGFAFFAFGVLVLLALLWLIFKSSREELESWKSGENRYPLLLLLSGVLVLLFYCLQSVLPFPWYAVNFFAPLALGLILALKFSPKLLPLLSILLLPGLVYFLQSLFAYSNLSAFPGAPYELRSLELRAAGRYFETKSGAKVLAAPEIGAIGFEFDDRILDTVGIATPEVLEFHPLPVPAERPSAAIGAIPPELASNWEVPIFVGYEIFFSAFLDESGELKGEFGNYRLHRFSSFSEALGQLLPERERFEFGELIVMHSQKVAFDPGDFGEFREQFTKARVPERYY